MHWIPGRANILSKYLSKYIIYIFFNFGCGFCGSFPVLFSKAPASCCKNILNKFFLHCVSQILKILFQRHTGKVRPGTRDSGPRSRIGALHLGPFTWDPEPGTFTWDPGAETLHLGLFTWKPGSGTWDSRPYMRDPIWNRDQILLRGTRDPYINTNLGSPTLTTFS